MSKEPWKVAVVGLGKIANDQHLPSIARLPDYTFAASVSRSGGVEGVENFTELDALLAARPDIEVISLCVPPQVRYEMARAALEAGRHVMLEKPPGATLGEVEDLSSLAAERGLVLYATWHSRHAPAVGPAKAWIAERSPSAVRINWKEDVREWHPGQQWIWEPGGLGVFDPGINALSMLTAIWPMPIRLVSAELGFPENRATPIRADLALRDPAGTPMEVAFDWAHEGPPLWDLEVDASGETLKLSGGGKRMEVDGRLVLEEPEAEYDGLYREFAGLLDTGARNVDVTPLRIVADAFLTGRITHTAPFHD
ncbi:Gfo/Idh/MocA family oxidoreductase (plasmid) [Paroceanicella profunda]|uniref:Gfo/Idh/MocA family oxidoreductase n=1 Tax=Paroceanicella profunda TaxID=2579971 RepID=A0A5B8FIQ0_9RHOB|nr:Gfo/Idh/MocA family oxidoreductase [Paroceanicella profunda]QDL94051.1 Gfo/Idh/MocA family oxidoreductase [Paroceanicella profunda]